MKIFNVKFCSTHIFPNGVEISFTTKDGVRKNNQYSDYFQSAFKIKTGLYSQVLIPIMGINATGKTSLLDLLYLVFEILLKDQKLNSPQIVNVLNKFKVSEKTPLSFEVIFLNDQNKLFKICSTISKVEDGNNSFCYTKEALFSCDLKKINAKNVNESPFLATIDRNDLKDNAFLKGDISILTSLNDTKTQYYFNPHKDKTILPLWLGTPYPEIVQCLDPSIKNLNIDINSEKNILESTISFKRDSKNSTLEVGKLNDLLSVGTIKGFDAIPSIINVLKTGGYYLIDEIENHINRRIVEFILGLFTDSRSNPHGACLIFTTHYLELLDEITRKDNIYITRRDDDNSLEVVRLVDLDIVKRNDVSKSKIFLDCLIKGSAPNLIDMINAKRLVIDKVNSQQE